MSDFDIQNSVKFAAKMPEKDNKNKKQAKPKLVINPDNDLNDIYIFQNQIRKNILPAMKIQTLTVRK